MEDDKQQSSNRKRKNTWSSTSNSIHHDEHEHEHEHELDRRLQLSLAIPEHQDTPPLQLPLSIPVQVALDCGLQLPLSIPQYQDPPRLQLPLSIPQYQYPPRLQLPLSIPQYQYPPSLQLPISIPQYQYPPRLLLPLPIPHHQDPPRLQLPLSIPLDLSLTLNPLSSSSSNNPTQQQKPKRSIRRKGHRPGKNSAPQFRHAKEQPCTIHSLKYLLENGIYTVSGEVECEPCKETYTVTYVIQDKFKDLSKFIRREIEKDNNALINRVAPREWSSPMLPGCKICKKDCDIVGIPNEGDPYEGIDWLFLLLGQFLGVCYRKQLEYFCSKNKIGHYNREVPKTMLLYRVYFELCRQLQPEEELFKIQDY